MLNEIYLRRKNKVLPLARPGSETPEAAQCVASLAVNLHGQGHTLAPELLRMLLRAPLEDIVRFHGTVMSVVEKRRGSHVAHRPMYPNFPDQVMSASDAQLYLNALLHYWSGGALRPASVQLARKKLELDTASFTAVGLGSEEELFSLFSRLMGAKTSLSPQDAADLTVFFATVPHPERCVPADIPLSETAALVGSLLIRHAPGAAEHFLSAYMRTATDILRLIIALSGGDPSLRENCRFVSFSRRLRVLLLGLLERCPELEEDMQRHKKRWLRVGERLHPGEYARFPKALQAFSRLRAGCSIPTFAARVDAALAARNESAVLELLAARPGELARRLDYLLRIMTAPSEVIKAFAGVAPRVSTRVLLQVREHFAHRFLPSNEERVFMPAGSVPHIYITSNTLPPLAVSMCAEVTSICTRALLDAYKQRKPLGKVYVNEEFGRFLVPYSQRSASKALRTISRGSTLRVLSGKSTIRAFLWWKNGVERTDLDLSAIIFDENWRYLEHISFTNLRSDILRAAHSGDIVDAPGGACEYIDIDIPSLARLRGRYVAFCVFSYTRQPFCDLPECFTGWMGRDDPKAGEIFEPSTVEQKIDLASNSRISLPMILDAKTMRMTWADIALRSNPEYFNCVEGNYGGVATVCKAVTALRRTTLLELVQLHITARGRAVHSPEEADVVFDLDAGITPFDTEIFQADFI